MHSEEWAAAIRSWAGWLAAAQRPRTVRTRYYQLRQFAEAHLDQSPWQLTVDDLIRFLSLHRTWSAEARKGTRAALRSFYSWAARCGYIVSSPAEDLPTIRVPEPRPRPADDTVFARALVDADDRTRLMLLLGRRAGLRVSEIAGLRLDDLDVVRGLILVSGKGGKARRVPMADDLRVELMAELERRRVSGHGTGYRYLTGLDCWLFPGTRGGPMRGDSVSRIISRALMRQATAHQLRHSCATSALAGTGNILAVQRLLGHSKPETTIRYTLLPDDAVVAAVRAASGEAPAVV